MPMSAPHPPHPTPLAQAVGTRSNVQCLEKWYSQLSPSMVSRGDWGPGDDRRLLRSLYLRCGCGCGGGGGGWLVCWLRGGVCGQSSSPAVQVWGCTFCCLDLAPAACVLRCSVRCCSGAGQDYELDWGQLVQGRSAAQVCVWAERSLRQ